jgi:hypothetical protein
MLVVVVGAVWSYSSRKTSELLDLGVNAHTHCAIEGIQPGPRFAPMLQPLVAAAGPDYTAVAAGSCVSRDRTFTQIVFRKDGMQVSVLLTARGNTDVFPRGLFGVINAGGVSIREAHRGEYSVAAFESGGYLGYIVSGLDDEKNASLAVLLAPIIDRYTRP